MREWILRGLKTFLEISRMVMFRSIKPRREDWADPLERKWTYYFQLGAILRFVRGWKPDYSTKEPFLFV